MQTSESDDRIALQAESEVEQHLLAELFYRLRETSTGDDMPTVWYSFDVPGYDGLDEELWREANDGMEVTADGFQDVPGGRALVVEVEHGDD